MANLILNFPGDDIPRDSQVAMLNGISEAIEGKKKFIIIQAPTGSGKSHIAATLSNSSNNPSTEYKDLVNSYHIFDKTGLNGDYVHKDILTKNKPFGCTVLTVTKALQDQYKGLFDEAALIKGKANYRCGLDEEFDCELAPCTISKKTQECCLEDDTCVYIRARKEGLVSKFSVQNYNVYLNLPDHVKRRQYIICDEASELEDSLVDYYSCTIEYEKIDVKKFGLDKLATDDPNIVYGWISHLLSELKDEMDDLLQNLQTNASRYDKKTKLKLMFKIKMYRNMSEKLILILQNWYRAEYIVEFDKDKCIFTPLYVNILAQNFFDYGDTVILMSGTIIDHSIFAKTLGIDSKDYKYIEVDSGFDPKHSPIYCNNKVSLSQKNVDKEIPGLAEMAIAICNNVKHKDHNGIIHTHTFKITQAIRNVTGEDPRYLFREGKITNESLIREHFLRKDKTVLVSPSLGFGTDLRDDFGRFQIIMKTPYLSMGSKRVKILLDRNQRWYDVKTLINLVQMCGRTTRSKDDYSDTYILDGKVIDLIRNNKNYLPRWFLHRLV